MATSTNIQTIRNSIATVLSDAGYTVYKYGANPDHAGRTFTVFGRVRASQDRNAMSDGRSQIVTVQLMTYRKEGGADETRAAAAETAVLNRVAEIETSLRADPTLSGAVLHTEPSTDLEVHVGADDDGWVFRADQTVEVRVLL